MRVLTRRGLSSAAIVAAVLVGVTGCGSRPGGSAGSNDARAASATAPEVSPASPATVRTARCQDWNRMDAEERQRLVAGMRAFFGGIVDEPGMRGQVMPADKALTVFDGYCEPAFAANFRLYRIYGDAAAFTPPE